MLRLRLTSQDAAAAARRSAGGGENSKASPASPLFGACLATLFLSYSVFGAVATCCKRGLTYTSGAQDVKIASAEEIKSKNSSSHICLGTDSPSLPKRTSSKDSIVPDIPVASPHTLRERTFGGSAVSWDQHGGAELMGNRHAVSAQQTRHSRHSQQHCRRGLFWYVRRFDTLAGGACQPRNARVDF